jgi:hypothetical protein
MREVGTLIWVVCIVIGVIVNIASSVRKQQAASSASARAPQPVRSPQTRPPTITTMRMTVPSAPPASAAPVSPAPVRRPQPPPRPVVSPPAPALHEAVALPLRRFFADGPSLVRAVIAAEVLGKPRALRDE